MKYKLILFVIAIACSRLSANAQADTPNYLLAMQIGMITPKLGMPVDSAARYLNGFTKVAATKPSEAVYKYDLDDVYIVFQKNADGLAQVILCSMSSKLLSTAQKAIVLMGMKASGTQAPPGYTAYATPKYAAFLNPEATKGHLSLVLVQGGK